ncbi:hypothetical protein QTO34_010879 [Cnephaeus nilssonii]|uniref:L1 transposable element RRM domain-containing protein n=1 Tax=Cnephaeus nilssonii TaxID=3371016 RepID=A0AA40HGC2_CNENI|nr:hypothetical protein QTO34_010879 [Eptesicus nilssonii]
MGRRNNSQKKENKELPRKEISETEACNMTEKEFRVMVVEFIHRMDEKINNLCKNQEEMKSDIATIENTMASFNNQVQKQAQSEQQLEKKIKKQEESLRELRDNMKRSNMRILGLPEGQEEQQGLENLFEEIMTENFPDMGKIKVTQVQRVPNRINPKRPTSRHVIISMANINDKERILKAARERQRVTYKGTPIRLSNDYSAETQQSRREWKEVYKVLQSKGLNPRILYPARLSIKIEGEIRIEHRPEPSREATAQDPPQDVLLTDSPAELNRKHQSRLEEAEDRISELEDKMEKNTQVQQLLETKIRKHEESLRELWDNTKQNNIRIIGVPEGKETEQGIENLFEEIITENFPDIGKKNPTQIQEAHSVPSKMNPKRPTPRHIIIKLANTNDKVRILKAARERQTVTYKGTPIRLATDFSTETHQARREWNEIYKVMQRKGLNPRILYQQGYQSKLKVGRRLQNLVGCCSSMTRVELCNDSDQQVVQRSQTLPGPSRCCFCPLDLLLPDQAHPCVCTDLLPRLMSQLQGLV